MMQHRTQGPCHRCQKLVAHQGVRLWDDQWYCLHCLNTVCSGLMEYYVANQSSFEETLPHSVVKLIGMQYVIYFVGITVFFGLPVCAGIIIAWFAGANLGHSIMSCMFCIVAPALFIILLFSIASGCRIALNRPTVGVRGGQFTVCIRGCEIISEALVKCEWFTSDLMEVNLFPKAILFGGPVLLSVIRVKTENETTVLLVPMGFTEEMSRLWKGFLALAGLCKVSTPTRRQVILETSLAIALFPVTFIVCFLIAYALGTIISFLSNDFEVAAAFGVTVILFGTPTIMLCIIRNWHWSSYRWKSFMRYGLLATREVNRIALFISLWLGTIAIVVFFNSGMSLLWRCSFSLTWSVWGYAIGKMLASRDLTSES